MTALIADTLKRLEDAHVLPSPSGSCTSDTTTNFSSTCPKSASPGASSASGLAVSAVVETNATHLSAAATLCA